MSWTWRYDGSGEVGPAEVFPSQSDAESWLGENWRTLLHGGVTAVTLLEDGREVYGPMGLEPA